VGMGRHRRGKPAWLVTRASHLTEDIVGVITRPRFSWLAYETRRSEVNAAGFMNRLGVMQR
jgi:hypothetical protein